LDESGSLGLAGKGSINVALGLRSGSKLDKFAKSFLNTFHSDEWKDAGVILKNIETSFQKAFGEAISFIKGNGGSIKFNLDSLDLSQTLKNAGKSLYDKTNTFTDWEFNQIINNSSLKGMTEFYKNGEKVDIDEVIKGLNR
jgi:hypothetical protein